MDILRDILLQVRRERRATGHFNASEADHMRAIVEACHEAGTAAIIGMSEGEREHLGVMEAVALRDAFRKEFNIAGTKEVVECARLQTTNYKLQPISIEGELGYLRGESKVQQEKIEVKKEDYTNPDQAAEFVRRTGVDRLAIAVGNIHGISLDEPDLDIERIRAIRAAVPESVALVLHAASGIPHDQIKAAIAAGIANIHVNTDLRVAYVHALKEALAAHPDEAAMYKLDAPAFAAMKDVVVRKLRLFSTPATIES